MFRKLIFAMLGCMSMLELAGCDSDSEVRREPASIVRTFRGRAGEMDIWRDRETGCQYFNYTSNTPLTSRLGSDGKPICGKEKL